MLGPVPYRGGDIGLEVGLFSIKSADLAKPYLSLMEDISNKAGVSMINTALQFAEPLKNGINLLVGGDVDTLLEIGISNTYNENNSFTSGLYTIIKVVYQM